jgi:rod shape-determining protein MreD
MNWNSGSRLGARVRRALTAAPPGARRVALPARPPRPEQVLRPVRPAFIWATLALGLLLNLLPWGRALWVPDFLALTLVFWNVHQPRRVGMGIAFVFGLLMDVHNGALFGEHALAYTLLSYGAISLHRRILWFDVRNQTVYVLLLLLLAQFASAAVRLWVRGASPGWWWVFLSCAIGAACWPLLNALLLAPQRRPLKRDDTRPL